LKRYRWFLGWFLVLLLSGCSLPGLAQTSPPLTPGPERTAAEEQIPTPELAPTPTRYEGYCTNVWLNQQMPAVGDRLDRAFQDMSLPEVDVQASAYGEACVDLSSNELITFSARQIDYYFNIAVKDANDYAGLGGWVVIVYDILEGLPPDELPGLLEIDFQDGSRSLALSFSYEIGLELMEQGLRGSSLIEAIVRR
jgi:hypothetical protein